MAIKDLTALRAQIYAQSQKIDSDSVAPTDVFGVDTDIVDSLDFKFGNLNASTNNRMTNDYQPKLQGSENGNIVVDQVDKRIRLAEQLKGISDIFGKVDANSILKIFCDADYQRSPEIYLSKALITLNALIVELRTNNVLRLLLDDAGVKISNKQGASIFEATETDINIFDAQTGSPLVTRDNNGNLTLFRKTSGSVSPVLSYDKPNNLFTLYNISNSPIISTTPTVTTYFDKDGNKLIELKTTVDGKEFAIFRGESSKPVIAYNPTTNAFTLFGSDRTGGTRKLIEQYTAGGGLNTDFYGSDQSEPIIREASGQYKNYFVNHELARAMYQEVTFKGTSAQWNALTPEQQLNYETVIIID